MSSWLAGFGPVERVGVEGTGAYGAGLARHLRSLGVGVIEVDRRTGSCAGPTASPTPLTPSRRPGRCCPGRATGVAKTADGNVEAMRALLIAKRSGREARITCLNQIRHLDVTAPDELGERFGSVPRTALAAQAAALRPRPDRDAVLYATKLAMRSLGRRVLTVDDEIAGLDAALAELVTATAPGLLGLHGVAVDTAAILCVAAATIPSECAAKPLGRSWAVSHPSRQPPANSPAATGSTGAGTARPTMRSGASCSPVSAPMPAPAPTSPAASTKASADPRSSAASSATSPARPTDTSHAEDLQRRAWPNNCPTPRRGVSFDRPADPPLHTHPARPWPNKSPPSPSGPSLVCQHRRKHLDKT